MYRSSMALSIGRVSSFAQRHFMLTSLHDGFRMCKIKEAETDPMPTDQTTDENSEFCDWIESQFTEALAQCNPFSMEDAEPLLEFAIRRGIKFLFKK